MSTKNINSQKKSNDVPPNSTFNNGSKDDKQVIIYKNEIKYTEIEHCPTALEHAPFPRSGILDEVTHTLSRVKSDQTEKSSFCNQKNDLEGVKESSVFQQIPYHTEGIRNPGWLTVISSFLVNFFVFGTTFCWGNYQKLYIDEIYAGQTNLLKIAFVGTSASALLLALGMFITPVIQRIGFRGTMSIGTIIVPLSLILASFATQLWHVYLSQGILFGIGASFAFSSSITLPSQWFNSKRALATGIALSGSSIGGVCLSPMIEKQFTTIGLRNTLRVQGCFGFGLLCLSTALATSRYRPPSSLNGKDKWYHIYDASLISRQFLLLWAFGFFLPFGYLVPFFLTPQYVQTLGLGPSDGAAMISVMSAANTICRLIIGYLTDLAGKFNTMLVCTLLAGLFTMILWQFSTNYLTFVVYCILYGLMAGGFISLLPVITADIVGVENIQKGLSMIYMTTVIGNLLGTPIIGLLLDASNWTAAIQFTGSMLVISALFMLILRMLVAKGEIFVKV